jgi:hypothetical protein
MYIFIQLDGQPSAEISGKRQDQFFLLILDKKVIVALMTG